MAARIRVGRARVLMPRLPKMTIGTRPTCMRARASVASSAWRFIFAYSRRRSAALCKMPLLATDDSIITLRKSYYLGRAICESPHGNVVPCVCARERASERAGPIYLIMMLLAIMKDSGICRTSSCAAPRATPIIQSRKVSRVTYTKPRPVTCVHGTRDHSHGVVIAYMKSALRRYVYQAERANCMRGDASAIPKNERIA